MPTLPTFLLLAALSASAAAPSAAPVPPAPAPVAAGPAASPCDGAWSLTDAPECGDAPLCGQRQRVELACQVRDALEKRYVFLPVKAQLLSRAGGPRFDARRALDACVEGERAVAREDDPTRFYDRMRQCVASFQDGHLELSAPARLPQVALGIGLRRVEGRVYIANVERKLVAYLRTISAVRDLDELLAPGTEVLAVDGRPVGEVLGELARYIPASSDGARLERAVDALTRRDFDYPQRHAATLVLSLGGKRRTLELPWWASPDAESHVMTQAWIRRTGVATTELLDWRYDQGRNSWDRDAGSAQGWLRTDAILGARDAASLREYTDDAGRPAARLGEVVRRRDRAFCYAQLLTFHTENLSSAEGRQPFTAVLQGFLKQCKDKQLDLVLDLRQNGGGYISHSSALVAMLGEGQKAYPGGALLVRANTLNQLVYQQRAPMLGGLPARTDDAFEPRRVAEAIGAARRAHQDYTPTLLEHPVHADGVVGGYDGKVVALTAPTCMSACDRVAALLRASGRAVLVGEPTEGAGGSQQEAQNLAARWTDPEGLVAVSIPNAAMGVQAGLPVDGVRRTDLAAAEFFSGLSFENRPVEPDVPYSPTLRDLAGHNRGWLERVEAVLFGGR
ncbi:S41 family peptidase [Anaeromyxobacter paludicola]|uniref:Tail specific protease domain-containing protein n=1 Tax=Anaeromyxobacter paludicola TaxID=2918171 RepID=A0ABN6NDS0_9BACT|nr:S41 family peptidase [Anaeromyxobacter paludicola]BDG10192.1 hypothetical protein AMPC_33050 [Anaeromyxobacter paludicola]